MRFKIFAKRALPAVLIAVAALVFSCAPPVSTGDADCRVIGSAGEPAFQNSWTNYGSGFANAAFRKDADGYVHLRGTIQGGAASSVIFTLPGGYRTGGNLMIAVYRGALNSSAGVITDGTIMCGTQFTSFVSLDNVVYNAEQ